VILGGSDGTGLLRVLGKSFHRIRIERRIRTLEGCVGGSGWFGALTLWIVSSAHFWIVSRRFRFLVFGFRSAIRLPCA
jgi:hypothetical protein